MYHSSELFVLKEGIDFSSPLWYTFIAPFLKKYLSGDKESRPEGWENAKKELIALLTDEYQKKSLAIEPRGQNDDQYRKGISRIIIHHTGFGLDRFDGSISDLLSYINIVQLVNLYIPVFSNPKYREFRTLLYSGHYQWQGNEGGYDSIVNNDLVDIANQTFQNQQVFTSYHWLIFPDGRILKMHHDSSFVWHALSNNDDSIGLCLVGNMDEENPTDQAIESLRKVINACKDSYKIKTIQGHKDVRQGTSCPGKYLYEAMQTLNL